MVNNYLITNEELTVTVSSKGAEIISIRDNKTGFEYIWQGDDAIWSDHFYNIFPICGRLLNDVYVVGNNQYRMNLHGFALYKVFKVKKHTENFISLSINEDDETIKIYPYKFTFTVNFKLVNRTLIIEYEVENNDKIKMYYSLGAHPGLNLIINNEIKFDDYYIETQEKKIRKFTLNEQRIIKKGSEIIKSNTIQLSREMFQKSAQIYETDSDIVNLKCKKSDFKITLSHLDEFKYLTLFSKGDAPILCIEPWGSLTMFEEEKPNLEHREGFIKLLPKEKKITYFMLEV